MSKITLGFITNNRLPDLEDKKFVRLAKKVGVDLAVFNAAENLDLKLLKEKAKRCDLIFNDDAGYLGLELAKSLEFWGSKVIELSKIYYYIEDKWMFYLSCLKNKIPVPQTILLSTDLVSIKKELKDFGHFPVVLKRVAGYRGEFVDKADDVAGAVAIIKRFWEKGEDRFPILAQEFIDSYSYRILTIGGAVEQAAIKKSTGWKATGSESVRFYKFKVDPELRQILNKLKKAIPIAVCGVDLAKKNNHWVVIEVNAEPSFKFFDSEYDDVVEKILRYLKTLALKQKR